MRRFLSIATGAASWFRRRISRAGPGTGSPAESAGFDRKLVCQTSPARLPSASQLKYLPHFLSPREQLVLRITSLVVVASLLVVGVRFLNRHLKAEPAFGGSYSEALVGTPNRINPLYAPANDVDRDIARLVYSGLFRQNASEGVIPDLATGYEVSEDQKSYTVHLRPDAFWHDGEPVTVDDVLFTFESIQNPEYLSPLSINFQGITIERVDEQTVKFVLTEPFAPFIGTLTVGLLPQHLWADVPPLNVGLVEYNLKPIGSGPYVFDQLARDRLGNIKSYELVRNERYYRPRPYIERLVFRLYPDFASAIDALRNKKTEGISYVPTDYKEDAAKVNDLNLLRLYLPQYTAVFFNQKRNEVLKDRMVRQALNLATDKAAAMAAAVGEDGVPVNGPILPGMLGFHPEMKTCDCNLDEARRLLDEAGWKLPEGGTVRKRGDRELALTLTTSQIPSYERALAELSATWSAVGVRVEAQVVEANRIQNDIIRPRAYDALLYGEVVGYDPDPYPFWHSSQQTDPGLSLSIFYRKDADKALEAARKTTNADERTAKYVEFQNIIAEEFPAVFLYQPIYPYGLGEAVKGYPTTLIETASDRLAEIERCYVKTKLIWQ